MHNYSRILGPQLYMFPHILCEMEPVIQADSNPWGAHMANQNRILQST